MCGQKSLSRNAWSFDNSKRESLKWVYNPPPSKLYHIILSPENWWLEDEQFPFKMVPFSGSEFVHFRVNMDTSWTPILCGQNFYRNPRASPVKQPENDSFQGRNLLFQGRIFRWTMLNFRGVTQNFGPHCTQRCFLPSFILLKSPEHQVIISHHWLLRETKGMN